MTFRLTSIPAVGIFLFLSLLATEETKAATFTIQDPVVDFEAIDGSFFGPYDGKGDVVFSHYSPVIKSLTAEARELAEFDIGEWVFPEGEAIANAKFEVQITSLLVLGLGVKFGENPTQLGVFGYAGNGIAEASDFEAGELLNTLDISHASVGDVLSFDVTDFIDNLFQRGETFAGLGIRAMDFGGLAIPESSTRGFPRLTITTKSTVTASVPESSFPLGLLILGCLGAGSAIKRRD